MWNGRVAKSRAGELRANTALNTAPQHTEASDHITAAPAPRQRTAAVHGSSPAKIVSTSGLLSLSYRDTARRVSSEHRLHTAGRSAASCAEQARARTWYLSGQVGACAGHSEFASGAARRFSKSSGRAKKVWRTSWSSAEPGYGAQTSSKQANSQPAEK